MHSVFYAIVGCGSVCRLALGVVMRLGRKRGGRWGRDSRRVAVVGEVEGAGVTLLSALWEKGKMGVEGVC